MRAIVTGSRDWPDRRFIWRKLDALQQEHGYLEVVHGGDRNGADAAADDWCLFRKVTPHVYRAWFDLYGQAAVKRRNEDMMKAGADMVLAFIRNECREARDVLRLAELRGIHTETEVINDVG